MVSGDELAASVCQTPGMTNGSQPCYTCDRESALASMRLHERIFVDDHWRVAHSFNSSLLGWLVLAPRRHITSIAQLTADEAGALGPWLHRLSGALARELGCQKTYVAQFAEAHGFSHVHFHVVPRPADLPDAHRGPGIFHYLRQPESEWITGDEMDALARALRDQGRYPAISGPLTAAFAAPGCKRDGRSTPDPFW